MANGNKCWVQIGHDVIYFSGRKKQQFKKFTPFNNLKHVEDYYKKEGGTYYVYYGTVKPLGFHGAYHFINNKLTRLDYEDFSYN
jgi:hypothetical protein